MKTFWLILRLPYLFWAILTFVVPMIVVFLLLLPITLLPKKPRLYITSLILRTWGVTWCTLCGIILRSRGRKPQYPAHSYVIVSNHSSFLDTPALYFTVRFWLKFLAKSDLHKTPIMGSIIRVSTIPVNRKDPESRERSIRLMLDELAGGISVLLFPEGSQNRSPNPLTPFYDGAFRVAIEAQVPVLPVVSVGARRLMPQFKFSEMRPGVITHHFLEPIETQGMTRADLPALKEKVYAQMEALLKAEDSLYKNA